jgi:molybdate transport system substrate-binding protein
MKFGVGHFLGLSVLAVVALIGALYMGSRPNTSPTDEQADEKETGAVIWLYCAAGIRKPIQDIVKEYSDKYGVRLEVDYLGSGDLLGKMRVAESGDLYLAADRWYMDKAREEGLIEEVLPIAAQYPVIAYLKGNPKGIDGIEDLLDSEIDLSLPDPDSAAIGRVAKDLLGKDGPWEEMWEKKTTARTKVNEVANDIKIGAVDAGIVWNATADQYPELEYVVPKTFRRQDKQIALAVLKSSKNPTRALHFARYVTARDKGLEIFDEYGYDVIDGDPWAEQPRIVMFSGGVNRPVCEKVVAEFEDREGVVVDATYTGCGVLCGNMKAGQIPDIYFSCDVSFMRQVDDLFEPSVDIASTDMVLIARKDDPKGIESIADLARDDVKVVINNPEHSALGSLCHKLLGKSKYDLWNQVYAKAVDHPTTADVAVMAVVMGSADASIVYRANTIKQARKLKVMDIDDPDAYAIQPIAVGNNARYPNLTQRLMERISAEEIRERYEQGGFNWLGGETTP